jgi:hypothetical protein
LAHFGEGINDIAFGLTHFLSFRISNQGMDVDIAEGDLACQLDAHHDHSGYPKKENVQARDQRRGGIERFEVLRLLWPPECGEWP